MRLWNVEIHDDVPQYQQTILLDANTLGNALKWVDLVRRSTITTITESPFEVGSPMMKSMVTSSQTASRIDKGCKRLIRA